MTFRIVALAVADMYGLRAHPPTHHRAYNLCTTARTIAGRNVWPGHAVSNVLMAVIDCALPEGTQFRTRAFALGKGPNFDRVGSPPIFVSE